MEVSPETPLNTVESLRAEKDEKRRKYQREYMRRYMRERREKEKQAKAGEANVVR